MPDENDVRNYLADVKDAIRNEQYTYSLRDKNTQLETDYVICPQDKNNIIMSLEVEDFSHTLTNKNEGYEHETLYVFGKNINLLERFGSSIANIPLYIKFNKLANNYTFIISFHKQEHPLPYPFKNRIP